MGNAAMILGVLAVLAVAYVAAPRAQTLFWIGVVTAVGGAIALFGSPTVAGFGPGFVPYSGAEPMARYGPVMAAALFAAATTALVCAGGLRRRSPHEREADETGRPA